jgi:hypothetical protein
LLLVDLEWRGEETFKLAITTASKANGYCSDYRHCLDRIDELARKARIHGCVVKTQDMAEAVNAITLLLENKQPNLALSD